MSANQNIQNIKNKKIPSFPLTSPSGISNGNSMRPEHTYRGGNRFPGLSWSAPIPGARSYVALCVDTHPVAHGWIHLYLPYIAPSLTALNESLLNSNQVKVGKNSFGTMGYGGPQPPPGSGSHNYVFVVLALDGILQNAPEEITSLRDFVKICDKNKIQILQYGLLNMRYEVK